MKTRYFLAVIVALLALFPSTATAQCESQVSSDVTDFHLVSVTVIRDFEICYDYRLEADMQFARHWFNRVWRVAREKYGLRRLNYRDQAMKTILFLVPQLTSTARAGYTANYCCYYKSRKSGLLINEIHYLTPSAWPNWIRVGICWPNMDEYHAHYLMHEMMHAVQFSLRTDDAQNWVMEALAEYDSLYSVTGCGTDFLQWKWAEMDRAAGEVAA